MDTASLQAFNNAVTLAQNGKKAEAHALLRQVLLSYPENISVLLWLVFTSPKPETALRFLEKAQQLEPNNPSVIEAFRWINLAGSATASLANSPYAPKSNGNHAPAPAVTPAPPAEAKPSPPSPVYEALNSVSVSPPSAPAPAPRESQPPAREIMPVAAPVVRPVAPPPAAPVSAESSTPDVEVVVTPIWTRDTRRRRPKIIPMPREEAELPLWKRLWQRWTKNKKIFIGSLVGAVCLLLAIGIVAFLFLRPKSAIVVAATQPVPIIPNAIRKFDFTVVDSTYTQSLDKIILIGANQNRIHIVDPNNGGNIMVVFTKIALNMSISPDGKFAAVGHVGQISYIDLQTATIAKVFEYDGTPASLVLGGNGWIYVAPEGRGKADITGIEIASGRTASVAGEYIYGRTLLKLHPNGKSLYGASRSLTPSVLLKLDISRGAPIYSYSSFDNPVNKQFEGCGNFWFSSDGKKIFTACGTVLEASDDKTKDLTLLGKLENMQNASFVTHADAAGRLLVLGSVAKMDNPGEVTGYGIRVYNYDDLTFTTNIQLPEFELNDKNYSSSAIAIYYNPSTNRYFAILQANEKKINQYGLLVGDLK